MSSKPRTRKFFPKMKQRGRYRAYRAPRTNLFPGLEQFRQAMEKLAAAIEAHQLLNLSTVDLRSDRARQTESERARISASAAAPVTSPQSRGPQLPYTGPVRGAVPNLVLVDETHLLRDSAVRGRDVFPMVLAAPNDPESVAALAEVTEPRVSWWRRVFGRGRR